MQSKRGQGLSTNAIILIILGIVVLVVLILGFTLGWGALKERLGGGANVDQIVQACGTACSTQSAYDFCMRKRELKSEEETLKDVTCNYLSKQKQMYGINECSAIPCDNIALVTANNVEELSTKCEGNEGKTVQSLINKKLESYDCLAS